MAGKKFLLEQSLAAGYATELEVNLFNGARRADVYLPEEQLAFEVQCSRLSNQEFEKRTAQYRAEGLQVRWLFGERYKIGRHLTAQQRQMLSYHQHLGFYMFFLLEGEVYLYYHIKTRGKQAAYQRQKITDNLIEALLHPENIVTQKAPAYQITSDDLQRRRAELAQGLALHNLTLLWEQSHFYLSQLNLLATPDYFIALLVHRLPFIPGTGSVVHHKLLHEIAQPTYSLAELSALWQPIFADEVLYFDLPQVSRDDYLASYLRQYLPIYRATGLCQLTGTSIRFDLQKIQLLFLVNAKN